MANEEGTYVAKKKFPRESVGKDRSATLFLIHENRGLSDLDVLVTIQMLKDSWEKDGKDKGY